MFRIYLAGYISGNKIYECIEWRKRVHQYYRDRALIIWLDPLLGKDINSIDKEGLKSSTPDKAIIHRDYKNVKEADLIIANLDTFGESRPLIGTLYELAWAWTEHKPVIVIAKEHYYKEHPFIADTVSAIVSSVDELLKGNLVDYFYKGSIGKI